MLRGLVVAVLIVFVGNEWSERVRLRQEEAILEKLPEAEAIAYYEELKKRVRRTRIMRGLVLVCTVLIVFALKKMIFPHAPDAGTTP